MRGTAFMNMSDYVSEEKKLTSSYEKSKSIEHIHNIYIVILLEKERNLFHSVFLIWLQIYYNEQHC